MVSIRWYLGYLKGQLGGAGIWHRIRRIWHRSESIYGYRVCGNYMV